MAGAGPRGAQQVKDNFKSVEGKDSKMFDEPINPPCPTGAEENPSWMEELDGDDHDVDKR